MSRDRVLERIRAALAASAGPAAPHAVPAHGVAPADRAAPAVPPTQPVDDHVTLFVERSRQVGVRVELTGSLTDAGARAAALCVERGVGVAAAWHLPEIADVLAAVQGAGVEVLSADATPGEVAAAGAGITGADWGIAESGTLVLASGPQRPRLASLLPAVHLAVLRADRVLPDLAALFACTGDLPSAFTFITGPSRSADIGFTPVLGAHGPTEVLVLVVEG
jgi:L-lactate dehydrogenase complex protein LldG